MNTTTIPRPPAPAPAPAPAPSPAQRPDRSARRRNGVLGVVVRGQTYRSIGYVILGAALGTIWFSVLVTAVALGFSLLVVALLGIPVLLATWYVVRAFANVERVAADALLGRYIPLKPLAARIRGNPWIRLRTMSRDRARWRELGFLLMRFPVGLAALVGSATALAVPGLIAYAPFAARLDDDQPFGNWALSDELTDVASSTWAWLLVPAGVVLLVPALHLVNAIATASGRWAAAWLGEGSRTHR